MTEPTYGTTQIISRNVTESPRREVPPLHIEQHSGSLMEAVGYANASVSELLEAIEPIIGPVRDSSEEQALAYDPEAPRLRATLQEATSRITSDARRLQKAVRLLRDGHDKIDFEDGPRRG